MSSKRRPAKKSSARAHKKHVARKARSGAKHTRTKARGSRKTGLFADEKGSLEARIVPLARQGLLAEAGRRAFLFHRKEGHPVVVKEGQEVVRLHPHGQREVLFTLTPRTSAIPRGVKVIKTS